MTPMPSFTRRFRRQHNRMLPVIYHWRLHIAVNLIMLAVGFAISLRHSTLTLTLAWLPVWCVIEYLLHRFTLHQWLKLKLARHHSVFHHLYFIQEDMHAQEGVDTNRILLLPLDLLSLLVATAVGAIILNWVSSQAIAASFYLAAVLYITLYETLHGASHLKSSPRLLQHWIHHHQIHHDPKRMHAVNFSVVLPWLDRVMGTKERE